jgi:eukaryotic-like serine/threonine-protein kinase
VEASPPEAPDPRIDSVLQGRYRIIEKLASGAMGVVYRGERVQLNRPVAVKFLHPWIAAQKAFLGRFENEAKAMSRLAHPNCVSVIDFGVEGTPYLVMDFAMGATVRQTLEAGPLEVRRALRVVRQLLAGLGHAHAQGIVHRDLKPENLILTDEPGIGEHLRILDFGLAKLRDGPAMTAGLAVGTPSYMSPEQTGADGAIDARTDLYTVGIVLFELLTGGKPFQSEKVGELLLMQREKAPPLLRAVAPGLGYSAELEAVVSKALSKPAADRYQTAAAFVAAIDATPEGRGVVRPVVTMAFHAAAPATPAPVTFAPPRGAPGALPAPAVAPRAVPAPADATTVDTTSAVQRLIAEAGGAKTPPARDRRRLWAGVALGGAAVAALLVGRALRRDDVGARTVATTRPEVAAKPVGKQKDKPAPEPAASPTTPVDVNATLEEARRLVAKGDWEQAIKNLEAARAQAPDNADLAYLQATIELDHHHWSAGLSAASAAVHKNPALKSDPDLINGLIQSLAGDSTAERSESLLRGAGAPAKPFLKDAAHKDPNAKVRDRAGTLLAEESHPSYGWSSRPSRSSRSSRSSGSVFHR